MPRYITVTVGCDWPECTVEADEGDDTVVSRTLSIDNKAGKTFLICKEHRDDLDEILSPLMTNGIKADAPAKKTRSTSSVTPSAGAPGADTALIHRVTPAGIDCQVEGCGRNLKNGAGIAQHVQRSHGFESYAAYKLMYDITD